MAVRKFKKFKRTFKRKFKKQSLALKAYKIAKSLKRKIEWKHYDYPITGDAIDTTGTTYPLLEGLGKEVNANARIGDFINLGRLHITGSVNLTSTAPINVGTAYRIIVCKGIRENQQLPVMTTNISTSLGVLDTTGGVAPIYARKYIPNIRDTKIIYDRVFVINPQSNTRKDFKWNFNVRGKTQYDAGGANLVEDGGLYLMIMSDNGGINAQIRMICRTTFCDE